ncbi:hypothetical protein D3C87_1376660 [compost metagenome]
MMPLDPLHQLVVERGDLSRHSERAIAKVPSRTTGNLRHFGRIEIAELVSVEFPVLCEGDMVDIEVEAHADRIGGHQIFDITFLIKADLRIAGARAERSKHDGGAAALAADQFGDRINLVGRKGDNRGPLRQARDLLLARIKKLRQARALHDRNAWQKILEDRPHGCSAEKKRLVTAAQMQDAVGKDMSALKIAGKLDFIDRDERGLRLARHRLDGADRITRHMRRDLLFPGDQCNIVMPDLLHQPRIDFAREQPERQADHA